MVASKRVDEKKIDRNRKLRAAIAPAIQLLEKRVLFSGFPAGDVLAYSWDGTAADHPNIVAYNPSTGAVDQTVATTIYSISSFGSEEMTLSADGSTLIVPGYATVGTVTTANRAIETINVSTGATTTTTIADTASSVIRGVASSDGSEVWYATASKGVEYAPLNGGTVTPVQITASSNARGLTIANGQLYVSADSSTGANGTSTLYGPGTVGSGLPTSGTNTVTALPTSPTGGFTTSGTSDFGFVFTNANTLYIANSNTSGTGSNSPGIQKFTYNGSAWVFQYATTDTALASNEFISLSAAGGNLFATSNYGTSYALVKVTDTGSAFTFSTLATVATPGQFESTAAVPGPTIGSVSPATASTNGGNNVTINGSEFGGATQVTFGGTAIPASSFVSSSANSITVLAPAHAAATVDITVTTPSGTSATSSVDQYTYTAAPAVGTLSPSVGPAAGGTTVTITGSSLSGATAVNFGTGSGTAGTILTDTATQITVVDPTEAAGTVDVTVVAGGVTSATGSGDKFTYQAQPIVTGISQSTYAPANSGVDSGGNVVTITGSNFAAGSTVKFGTVAATSVTIVSSTSIVATSPAQASGSTVDITVSDTGGTSATGSADQFTYTLTTIGDAEMLPSGTPLKFDNNPVITQILDVYNTNRSFLIDDGTGSAEVYSYPVSGGGAADPQNDVGDAITINGTWSPFSQIQELSAAATSVLTVVSTGHTVPAPLAETVPAATTLPLTTGATGIASHFVTLSNVDVLVPAHTTTDPTPTNGVFGTINFSGTLEDTAGNQISFLYYPGNYAVAETNLATTTLPTGLVNITGIEEVPTSTTTGIAAGSPVFIPFLVSNATTATSVVTGVSPNAGAAGGTNTVTISGFGFDTGSVTAVKFGSASANLSSLTVVNDNTITIAAPAGTLNTTVDVQVTTSNGSATATSATSANDHYTYTSAPVVSSVTPSGGNTNGGTTVTITGSGFTGETGINFGTGSGTAATSILSSSDTQLVVTDPAESAGTVYVTVTASNGVVSATSSGDAFTYSGTPVVTSLTVGASGPSGTGTNTDSGGTTVTITGSSFTSASTVTFGGIAARKVTYVSPTSLVVVSPSDPGAAAVDVVVSTVAGTSATSSSDVFTYTPTTVADAIAYTSGTNSTSGVVVDNAIVTAILSQPGTTNGQPYTNYSFLVNDGTGSIDIYGTLPTTFNDGIGAPATVAVGDKITVYGTFSPYNQLPELEIGKGISSNTSTTTPFPSGTFISSGNPAPAGSAADPSDPTVYTIPQVALDTLPSTIAGHLVTLNNVTISGEGSTTFGTTNSPSTPAQSANAELTDSSGNMIVFYYQPSSYSAANQFFDGLAVPSGPVNLTGIISVYKNQEPEFIPISEAGILDRFTATTTVQPEQTTNGVNSSGAGPSPDGAYGLSRGSQTIITVSRTETTDAASVTYTLANDSGVYGTDFTSPTGQTAVLNFAAGVSTATVTINTTAATGESGDKLFTFSLTTPTSQSSGYLPQVFTAPFLFDIADPNAETTVSENAEYLNDSIKVGGPNQNSSGVINQAILDVFGNNPNNAGAESYALTTFGEGQTDMTDYLATGETFKQIDGVELELQADSLYGNVSGPLNIYLVTNTEAYAGNSTNPYSATSGLVFQTSTTDGLGTQLGAKYLLGTVNYNALQAPGVYTPLNLTNLDPTGVALLAKDLSNGNQFTVAITPGNSTVNASFVGLQGTKDLQSPILRVDYSPNLPSWVTAQTNTDNSSTAVYIVPTATLVATSAASGSAATIVADPTAAVDPSIYDITAGSIVTVAPTTNDIDVHLGGITLDNGANLIMSSVGSARSHSDHNVLVLGTVGNATAPAFSIGSSSTLDLTDNDLIVHSAASDDANGSGTSSELTTVQTLEAKGRNVAAGGTFDGTYTGTGLTSSSAASVDAAAGYEQNVLGVVLNSDQFLGDQGSGVYNKWTVGSASESLAMNDIIVKYTYNGDAALEGLVSDDDSTIFNAFYAPGVTQNDFAFGDFNGDGKVDDTDSTIFNALYGNGTAGSGLPQL